VGRLFTAHQIAYNHAVVDTLGALCESSRRDDREALRALEARLRNEIASWQAEFYRVHQAMEVRIGNEIGSLRLDLHRVHQAALDAQAQVSSVREGLQSADARASDLDRASTALSDALSETQHRIEALALAQRIKHALVDLFLRESGRVLSAAGGPEEADPGDRLALDGQNDELYEAIENAFRGSFESVSELQRPYLDDVLSLSPPGPVLDLGSGRGEWLDLLVGAGVDAYGVDLNAVNVEESRRRGLDVRHEDALGHLATLVTRSVSAISAFHLVEHLTFEDLMTLLDEAVRVLRPGGLLLVETPNPDNVLVGSGSFYLDPTHRRPLPPRLLEFLVASRGFHDVEVRSLHPADETLAPADHSETARKTIELAFERLNMLLFGPQDYAVLARRPPG
jgi:O-antigen chain-terminating methyltransferase